MTRKRLGIFFLALGCSIAGLAQTEANLTPPVLLMPVCAGLRELTGVTPLKLGRVQVAVNGRDVGERTVTTGQFALSIPALKVNQFVEVTFRYKDTLGKERSLRSTYDVSGDGVCKPAEAVAKAEETKPAAGKPVIQEVAKPEVAKEEEPAPGKKTEDKSAKAVNDALSPVTIKALVAGAKKIAGTTPVKKGKITAEVGGVETESVKVTDAKFEIDLEAADSKVKGLKENQEVAVTFTYEADGKEGKLTAKATVGPAPYTLQLLKEVVDAARNDPGKSCDPEVTACAKADKLTVAILKNGVPGTKVEGNGVIESYSLNPDGEKSELLQAKDAKVEKGRASASFGDNHIGGLYVAKVDIEGTVVSVELKDPSAGIVARGVDEGDDSLTARMPKETDKVDVIVVSGDLKQANKSAEILEANYDSKKRVATLDYPNRFAEGQGIGFIAKDKDGKVIARSEGMLVEPSGYDWGRVKAYFSVGSVLAQNEGKFKNLAPYLRFNMEYNFVPFRNIVPVVVSRENRNVESVIAQRVYNRTNAVQLQQQAEQNQTNAKAKTKLADSLFEEALRLRRTWHFALTGYADAQLTENPVAIASTDVTKPLTLSLRQSPTSGYFEYGLYMPVSAPMMQWTFKNLDNALYVAPLVKFGFMTVSNQVNEGQASSSYQTFAAAGAYKFYAGGFRVGHFAVKNDPNNAPENISFVDLAIGRYGVFRWRRDPSENGSPEIYPVRVDIRGNFKIPATPFFIGLGANMGAGPDDIRILFGVRMNLAKLFGTVLPKL